MADNEALWESAIRPYLMDGDYWSTRKPEEAERLREVLLAKYLDTERVLGKMKSDRMAFQQECHALGETGKRAWFESIPEYEDRRKRQRNFQSLVQRRLRQMTTLAKQARVKESANRAQDTREALRRMAVGVARHQREIGDPRPADLRLWNLLESLWIPIGEGEATLAMMLDDVWTDEAG